MKINSIKEAGFSLWTVILGFLLYISVVSFLFGLWIQRNLDFWLTHFKGTEVHVPFVACWLLGFLAPLDAAFLVLSEIIRAFI